MDTSRQCLSGRRPPGRAAHRATTRTTRCSATRCGASSSEHVVPHHRQWERDAHRAAQPVAGGRGAGAALPDARRGVWRRGRGFRLLGRHHRGDRADQLQRRRLPAAFRHRRALHRRPRHRRSASANGCRSMARGEIIGAIAMTEPGMGSDLKAMRTTARRDGDHYVIDGQQDLHQQRAERRAGHRRAPRPTRRRGGRASA